jgi:hypothetical protein
VPGAVAEAVPEAAGIPVQQLPARLGILEEQQKTREESRYVT